MKDNLKKELAKLDSTILDEQIAKVARLKVSDVVRAYESGRLVVDLPAGEVPNAENYMICRMFTDAIFSQDIRMIQLIINRIDGGLPKDTDMQASQTEFSDCFKIILAEPIKTLKVHPDDTVMMALCKALYALATQDIYWDPVNEKSRRPSVEKKQERDAAMRMVLERTGGRKTISSVKEEREDIESADWIASLNPPSC